MLTLNFSPFPQLHTQRLLLRKITPQDVNEIFFLRSDERVMKYIDKARAKNLEEAAAVIEKFEQLEKNLESIAWAITLSGVDTLIGTICLWNIKKEHYRAELGYVLHPDHHGKKIMQEAVTVVLHYGFNVMKLHSVEAVINPANMASKKLLEKNNFVREGYFKENFFYNGKFLDSAVYSLLSPKKIGLDKEAGKLSGSF